MTQQPWGPPSGQRPPAPQWGQPPAGHWSGPQWGQQPHPPGWGPPPGQPQGWPGQQQRPGQPPYLGRPPVTRPPGFGYQPPRPPQRNPLASLLKGMITLAVLAVLGLVAVNTLTGESSSDVAYANEDYQVPPESSRQPELPPYPTTFEEAYTALTDNPLYDQEMPEPVRCELPAGDPAQMSPTDLDAYFTEQVACLTRAWEPPTTAAGYTAVRPSVTVYRDQVTSGCGNLSGDEAVNAFYCASDQAMYFSTLMFDYIDVVNDPWVPAMIMAHEYGHNVQARTNLLVPSHLLMGNLDDEGEQLEINRRLEVQADCFAGAFFTSTDQSLGLTGADYDSMLSALYAIGDDQLTGDPDVVGNHGHGDSRQLWGERGWNNTSLSVCNSFVADAAEVE